ncbi:hypothetical protein [Pyrobaculum aerophilum]|uniref:hypothetical protein n=1 Tax=Pyrobaculum aerophilum TaxID=13773 RepID=UPI0023F3EA67|nr:hypothetical protein [Pyrobaculum aerophilum]MCX8135998.1 hypothetical protein [Pyrobaculum aerophilum]
MTQLSLSLSIPRDVLHSTEAQSHIAPHANPSWNPRQLPILYQLVRSAQASLRAERALFSSSSNFVHVDFALAYVDFLNKRVADGSKLESVGRLPVMYLHA